MNAVQIQEMRNFVNSYFNPGNSYELSFNFTFDSISLAYCAENYYQTISLPIHYSPTGFPEDEVIFHIDFSLPDFLYKYYSTAIEQIPESSFKNPVLKTVLLQNLENSKKAFSSNHPLKAWHLIEKQILEHISASHDSWITNEFDRSNLEGTFLKEKQIFEALYCIGW